MRLLLLFVLAMLALVPQAQTGAQNVADLVVLKFSCGIYETRSSMIRSVQDPDPAMNEPIRINQTTRNEPQEIINRRDIQERRAELKTAEANAAHSNQPDVRIYFYRLEVKNTSTKVVKNFAWEYQPADTPELSSRQFFCVMKAKPKESKELELFSPLPPSRVINASNPHDKSEKNDKGKAVINKIEYMDGSMWQRPGWNAATFAADAMDKVPSGKCIGL
jgi:hypothetical protein